ncbi:MAG: YceI family protein [Chitinophagaceae bacterium]|nr:YceI family protein [Chitinophagaceae bacterium]MBK9486084.1 YceI family protein [Chitinophagaceae bacterium]
MKKTAFLLAAFFMYASCITAQRILSPIDASSKVHFVIKNFGIKTGGDFKGLKGTIKFLPANLAASAFDVTVDAATIDTDNESRDEHLRQAEYFDAATYKTIQITSTKITTSSIAGRFYMFANLTIKGVTKPVEFGFGATPKDGGYIFDGEFKINRRDFGVGGSSVSMSDNLTVSLSVLAM